jgi:hypothetical protein
MIAKRHEGNGPLLKLDHLKPQHRSGLNRKSLLAPRRCPHRHARASIRSTHAFHLQNAQFDADLNHFPPVLSLD